MSSKPDPAAMHEVVAMVHAPIHYQQADRTCYPADYLAAFDYDGDTDPTDNWDDFEAFDDALAGRVYWSVTETCTHWFVVYAMFA